MKMPIKMGLEGFFTFKLYGPDGELRRELTFKNLILDSGLERIGGITTVFNRCRVGSGSSTPVPGQTALDAQLGASTTVQAQSNGHDAVDFLYIWRRVTYRFDQGVGTGNISEVGVGWLDTGASLFSRALVLDGEGDPTTITKLADEVLDVTYELRIYPPAADVPITFNIGATEITATVRPQGVGITSYWSAESLANSGTQTNGIGQNVYTGALGTRNNLPAGSVGSLTAALNGSYSSGSYQRNFRSTAALNLANQLHRTYTIATNWCMFGVEISPTFTKLNTQILTLDWTVSWARRT